MTGKEIFDKNLELSTEFSRYVIANPEIGNELSPDSEIVFIVDSDPELSESNLKLANGIKKEGGKVIFVHIRGLLPKEASRLVEPHIETSLCA